MIRKINIGIAEDHDMVRQGFVRALRDEKKIQICFEARNGTELFNSLHSTAIDVLLLDFRMPEMDGRNAIEKLKHEFPQLKIIVISGYADEDNILEFVKQGADSFLPKESDISTLVEAILTVFQDNFYFNTKILELLERTGSTPPKTSKKLTDREKGILKLLCKGRTSEQISKELGIKEITIAGHKHRILQKTLTKSVEELRDYAQKHRYL